MYEKKWEFYFNKNRKYMYELYIVNFFIFVCKDM